MLFSDYKSNLCLFSKLLYRPINMLVHFLLFFSLQAAAVKDTWRPSLSLPKSGGSLHSPGWALAWVPGRPGSDP